MDDLKIVYLGVDELTPYEHNTRKHERTDIDAIKESIRQTGFNDPIGVWGEQNLIVEGHGRLIAAKELGLNRVPCIRLDHMTEEERRKYAILHNRTAELSKWEETILNLEISSLDFGDFDLGFDFDSDSEEPKEAGTREAGTREDEKREGTKEPVFNSGGVQNKEVTDGDDDPYLPEGYDDEEIDDYTKNQENYVAKRRVIITYLPEQESILKELLGLDSNEVKVVYDISELRNIEEE